MFVVIHPRKRRKQINLEWVTHLIQETLDFSLSSSFLVFERIGFRTIKVGFTGSWNEYTRKTRRMPNSKDILEWTEPYGGEGSMRNRMSEVERWRSNAIEWHLNGRFGIHLE